MEPTLNDALSRIDTVWVVVAMLVFFCKPASSCSRSATRA